MDESFNRETFNFWDVGGDKDESAHTPGGQSFQQRRLPGTIGARQQHTFPWSHLEGDVSNQWVVAVADCQVVNVNDRRMDVVDFQCFMKYCLGDSDQAIMSNQL